MFVLFLALLRGGAVLFPWSVSFCVSLPAAARAQRLGLHTQPHTQWVYREILRHLPGERV